MNQIDLKKLKVINYNRKSSESEDRQMLSIESQIDEASRISAFYGLADFFAVFKESKSAKNEGERKEFNSMIKMIKGGDADSIVCWKADRLARNMTEGGIIIDLLSSGVLKAIITHDKIFYPWDNTMILSIEFSQGKQFVKELSVNVKRGQVKKAEKGYPHGLAPIGYLNDKTEEKGNRAWMIDSSRFSLVKLIFERFLTGNYSVNKLSQYVRNELLLTTPKHKRNGGSIVALSYIFTMLKNPIYAGFFYQGGIRYELHEKLPRVISEAQHVQIKKMISSKNIPKNSRHSVPYAGYITSPNNDYVGQDVKYQLICDCKMKFGYLNRLDCPKCGIKIESMKNPKYLTYAYYYNIKRKKSQMSTKSLPEKVIDDYLANYLKNNLKISSSLADWSRKYIHELKDSEVSKSLILAENNEKKIAEIETKKKKLRSLLVDGLITNEEYLSDTKSLEGERMFLLSNNKKNNPSDMLSRVNNVIDLSQTMDEIIRSTDEKTKSSFLSKLGSNLIWDEEKLSIINTKCIQVLIDGLSEAKRKNPQFEPENIVDTSDSNEVFRDIRPIMLPR